MNIPVTHYDGYRAVANNCDRFLPFVGGKGKEK